MIYCRYLLSFSNYVYKPTASINLRFINVPKYLTTLLAKGCFSGPKKTT